MVTPTPKVNTAVRSLSISAYEIIQILPLLSLVLLLNADAGDHIACGGTILHSGSMLQHLCEDARLHCMDLERSEWQLALLSKAELYLAKV